MYLGIDVGTSAVKAIVVDEDQRVVAHAAIGYATLRPGPGLSEQHPDTWIGAVETALGQVKQAAGAAFAEIKAIGLSGQMHSLVMLDGDGKPLRPAILWNDGRGQAECEELASLIPDLARVTGVPASPGFTAAKLMWVRKHQPELFGRIKTVMLAKDYVRLWLTGEIATDPSDAAGTQLFDQAARRWAPRIVEAVGLTPDQMPRLVEGTEVSGYLAPGTAMKLGLRAGIAVAGGGGDAGTGSAGLGTVENGTGFISLGTAAVFVVTQDVYAPKPELMLHNFAHCIPRRWYQMAGMLNGASCLSWAMRVVGETDVEQMLARVEESYRRPSRLIFLPYLSGERTPHNNAEARGVLFGLDPATEKTDVIQAVLEGVAFSLKDAKDCLEAAGCPCSEPAFIGGGARSAFWGRIVATVLGQPIMRFRGTDLGPAFGAARLAIIASTGAAVSAICRPPEDKEIIEPDGRLIADYAKRHQRFRALYKSLVGLFDKAEEGGT